MKISQQSLKWERKCMKQENIPKRSAFWTINIEGKPQAEKLFYMFSQSYYKTKQYIVWIPIWKFVSSYPKKWEVAESAYLGAKSYSAFL
jgi:hypothetical protein